ncbi:MAG: sulfotransferase family 2 domain-containing protein [Pseudomonadota bacterium]
MDHGGMILSVHIRKCAGTSLRDSLKAAFGPRVLFDYGDHIGSSWPTSLARRKQRQTAAQANAAGLRTAYDLIHGHFYRRKYSFLGDGHASITMLRDPVERVLSNYHYLKRRPDRRNPDALIVNALGFSLTEFARHPDNRNMQSQVLETSDLSEFAAVGLVERYEESLAAFSTVCGVSLAAGPPQNVNQGGRSDYVLSAAERAVIENNNLADLRLYDVARRRITQLSWAC